MTPKDYLAQIIKSNPLTTKEELEWVMHDPMWAEKHIHKADWSKAVFKRTHPAKIPHLKAPEPRSADEVKAAMEKWITLHKKQRPR